MIKEGWGEEIRAPDKRGGKGQPPLQLMPCFRGMRRMRGRNTKKKEGSLRWRKKSSLDQVMVRKGGEEGRGSGLSREQEVVWQKLYNTNRKTVLVWKQRTAGGRLTSGEGGTIWQSHKSTGWATRRKVLWSHFSFSSS